MAQTNDFDFKAYNATLTNANAGLKLYLAESMLKDVMSAYTRWDNPLMKDVADIVTEIVSVRKLNKIAAAKVVQASGEVDNAGQDNPASSSADTPKDPE